MASGSNEYWVVGPAASPTYSTSIGAIRLATAAWVSIDLNSVYTMCSSSTPRMPSRPGSSPSSSAPAKKASTKVSAIF
ncbi:Uncharacterised protein [Mycobacteroides abscessus]|nr:Uncharacterised protein [Mycobacteroides abscessus]